MNASDDFFSALIRAYDLTGSHPPHHPSVRVALAEAVTKLEACPEAAAAVREDGLAVEGRATVEEGGPSALAKTLHRAGVTRVRLLADAGMAAVEELVRAARLTEGQWDAQGRALRALTAAGLELTFAAAPGPGRSGQGGPTGPDPATPPLSRPLPSLNRPSDRTGPPTDGGHAPEGDPRLARAAAALFGGGARREEGDVARGRSASTPDERPGLDAGLEEAVRAYAAHPDEGLADIITETVSGLASREELDRVVAGMAILVRAADEGPEDPRIVLARRLGRSEVLAHLGRALAIGEPDDPDQLVDLVAALGTEMADVLAQALTEASDRSHRDRYLEVLSGMGRGASGAVEDMIGDARWFVVRNGVRLLPEVAGGRAVEHLARALGHHDPRVRTEAARALARVAGDRAVRLLLTMLGDPDEAVRSATVDALGTAGGREVVPALLDRLGVETEANVQVEILRALGRIGDPRAVPSLSRRVTTGSFLVGQTDVRLAAVRALWALGTPEARTVVMQALEDPDPDVRGAARTLLGGH
jgi:HEAT repeat protein